MVLCAVGAAVIILGVLAPRFMSTLPPEPARKTSEKALPPEIKPSEGKEGNADKQIPAKPLEPTEAASLSAILTRLVGGTLFVLLLCAGTAYGVGRWIKGKNAAVPAGPLKLIAALPINARCSIFLVQAGDQHLVAGVDATGLRSILHIPGGINEIDEVEETAPVQPATAHPEAAPAVFAGRLPVLRTIVER